MILLDSLWGFTLTDCIQASSSVVSLIVIYFTYSALKEQIKANKTQEKSLDYLINKDISEQAPLFRFAGGNLFTTLDLTEQWIDLTITNLGKRAINIELHYSSPRPHYAIDVLDQGQQATVTFNRDEFFSSPGFVIKYCNIYNIKYSVSITAFDAGTTAMLYFENPTPI